MNFLPGQNFDCSGCAKCCRSPWQVAVDPASRKRMRELPVVLVHTESGAWVTPKRAGACALLTDLNRCSVHEQLGEEAKPQTCRQFPFLLQRTPDGLFVSVSLYCSAAQRNEGRPLAVHAAALAELELTLPAPPERILLKEGSWLGWEAYRRLELALSSRPALAVALLVLGKTAPGTLDPEALERALAAPLPPTDSMLVWMEMSFVGGLLARLEGSHERPELLQELMDDRPVVLGCLSASQVQGALAQGLPEWLRVELDRYREALLFRKFLLEGGRALLENLLVLHLVLRVAEFLTFAQALKRGSPLPDPPDWYAAVDRCELDLVTHGREAFAMSGSYLWFFLEHVNRAGE